MTRPLVLLLRHPQPSDPYEAALSKAGFRTRSIPVLSFEPTGQEALADRLSHPERFGGLIITSPRSARIVAEHLDNSDRRDGWMARPAYAVGPRTAGILRDAGFEPVGEESGTGEELAAVVIATYVAELPLLFLAGDRRRDAIPEALAGAGTPLEELTVYRTTPVDLGELDVTPEWVVLFSPSGVEAWSGLGSRPDVRYAAIGETTATALSDAGFEVGAVAAHPTPASLVDAIMRAQQAPH